MFIKLEDGEPTGHPIIEDNFRRLFPNTSFPRFFMPETVEPLGYGIYDFSNQPEVERYEKVIEVAPIRSDAGIWRQTWAVIAMDDAERLAADELTVEQVRRERNGILFASDWMGLSDVTMSDGWATYRQALRDVPEQAGFPDNVTWPTKPE